MFFYLESAATDNGIRNAGGKFEEGDDGQMSSGESSKSYLDTKDGESGASGSKSKNIFLH